MAHDFDFYSPRPVAGANCNTLDQLADRRRIFRIAGGRALRNRLLQPPEHGVVKPHCARD